MQLRMAILETLGQTNEGEQRALKQDGPGPIEELGRAVERQLRELTRR